MADYLDAAAPLRASRLERDGGRTQQRGAFSPTLPRQVRDALLLLHRAEPRELRDKLAGDRVGGATAGGASSSSSSSHSVLTAVPPTAVGSNSSSSQSKSLMKTEGARS